MSDPTAESQARIRAAADQFSAAIADALHLSFRKTIAKQMVDDFGPGPWVLHEDGSVEPVRKAKPRKAT